MTGVAIISLDCEGKWGVADHLKSGSAERITEASLREAYTAIAGALDEAEVPATFAFVELFIEQSPTRRLEMTRLLASEQPYLRDVAPSIEAGEEGWSAPWALDLLDARHEVATHGYSHTPWTQMTKTQAARELDLVPPERRSTLVFPRNLVAHAELLQGKGCLGFRGAVRKKSRLASLASEFDLFTKSEPQVEGDIPAGVFINWMSGARRLAPASLTRLRVRRIIEHAARTNGVAHFWTHPENIATHPETLRNFKAVVSEIARARDRGLVQASTQRGLLTASERN